MRIALSITKDYVPTWDARCGIREIVQNARDAQTDGHEMTVKHSGKALSITSKDVVLTHQALLLGHTTKSEDRRMIGSFGEGLKVGVLALIRGSKPVTIYTGEEIWKAKVEYAEEYHAQVLTFQIRKARTPRTDTEVLIENISKDEWAKFAEMFLFLNPPKEEDTVDTEYGTLLLDPRYAGRVYVKGILVDTRATLQHGYNFHNAELDRDRRVLNSYDQEALVRDVWTEALRIRPDLVETYYALAVKDGGAEGRGISRYTGTALIRSLDLAFTKAHGDGVFPVSTAADAEKITAVGGRAVVVPSGVADALQAGRGITAHVYYQTLRTRPRAVIPREALEPRELGTLGEIFVQLDRVGMFVREILDVVEFTDPSITGLWSEGRVSIARSILSSPEQTLRTVIHEAALVEGPTGTLAHLQAVENTWQALAKAWMAY